MGDTEPKSRWYRITPDRFVLGMLSAVGLLWMSERFQWFAFNTHKGWTVLIAVAAVAIALVFMFLWFIACLIFRWRFQFSIRSMLVLVVVVAIPSSWLAAEMKKASAQKADVEETRKSGGLLIYEYEGVVRSAPKGSAWLRKMLGDDFFNDISYPEIFEDAEVERLMPLPQLDSLFLSGSGVTDAGMQYLEKLTQLRILVFRNPRQITNAGLQHLEGLTRLQVLLLGNVYIPVLIGGSDNIVNPGITDAGLKHLEAMTQLQALDLGETGITDAGLPRLAALTELKNLDLVGTRVTDKGVKNLQHALPKCKIKYSSDPFK